MANASKIKPLSIAMGTAVAVSSLGTTAVQADQNPFVTQDLAGGYNLASADMEGKCGEGKCGGDKKAAKEGKCGEGKCGGDKKAKKEGKCGEGKCGEGKCGANHSKGKGAEKASEKAKEGKCGEGKCGEGKCGGKK